MSFRVVRPDLPPEPMPTPKSRRSWRAKFREAFRGIKLGIRGHSSFFVHFFAATLVIVTASVVQCDLMEWSILIGCIGLVLTAELFNSAIETLFRSLDSVARDRHHGALEIAAGAVLMASITAATVGILVLGRRILHMVAPIIGA
jgi:diacylglycerol kinase